MGSNPLDGIRLDELGETRRTIRASESSAFSGTRLPAVAEQTMGPDASPGRVPKESRPREAVRGGKKLDEL